MYVSYSMIGKRLTRAATKQANNRSNNQSSGSAEINQSNIEQSTSVSGDPNNQSSPSPSRRRGRPSAAKQPIKQRVIQRERNDPPITASRLLTDKGRESIISRPRRWQRKKGNKPKI